jgi:hypothetical protein
MVSQRITIPGALAALSILVGACALYREPEPIPADKVLAQPAARAAAKAETPRAGGDGLRGFLSAD